MKKVTLATTLLEIVLVCLFILFIGDEDCTSCYSADGYIIRGMLCGVAIIAITVFNTIRYRQMNAIAFNIANQPLLETDEATDSVSFSGEGTLVADTLIHSYFTQTPCLYYHAILRRKNGKTWDIVNNISNGVPFYLEDTRGRLEIDARNVDSDMSHEKIKYDNTTRIDYKWSSIDTDSVLIDQQFVENNARYSKSEYVLRPGNKAFVYGYVEKSPSGLVLREYADHPLIVSLKTHKEYIKEFSKGENLLYLSYVLIWFGFALIVLLPIFWHLTNVNNHILVFYIGSLVIIASVCFTMYNRIVLFRNRVKNAKSNIDTELKRRYDLVPLLVESVRGYMKHEKDVQTVVSVLRASSQLNASDVQAHGRLAVIAEAYPQLKTSDQFQKLMNSLSDTEERIAYSRNFYNASVRDYNTFIEQFPLYLFAVLFQFRSYEYISFETNEKKLPITQV